MAREIDEALGFLEKIPPRDKEVIILGAVFFWGKYMDPYGDVVGAVKDILSNHPARDELFSHLDDPQIGFICNRLDDIFEREESIVISHSCSSFDDVSHGEFASGVANTMLYLRAREIGIAWFKDIKYWKDRQPIIKAILREKLSGEIGGLLLAGEEVGGVE